MPSITLKNWKLKIVFKQKKKVSVKKKKPVSARVKEMRKVAREVVVARVEFFNQHYKLEYKRIFIKNQKTRWGSCSSKGNLNFNYRIATLPPELQDYLVVHELCHLREMNHGANFWNLVGEQIPDYKALSKQLRRYPMV